MGLIALFWNTVHYMELWFYYFSFSIVSSLVTLPLYLIENFKESSSRIFFNFVRVSPKIVPDISCKAENLVNLKIARRKRIEKRRRRGGIRRSMASYTTITISCSESMLQRNLAKVTYGLPTLNS